MAQVTRFTTEGISQELRLSKWDAALWGSVGAIRTTAHAQFDAEASFISIGALQFLRISTPSNSVERLPDGPVSGYVKIIVQRSGQAVLRQMGREVDLAPSQWTLCDTNRAYCISSNGRTEQLVLLLPRDRLGLSSCDLASQAARLFGGAGTSRVVPLYLASLLDELVGIDEGNCGELVDMAAQMVRLALFEARQNVPTISMRETLRTRVKDYVRRHLRDPSLTIDAVAAAFGCTKRHLHKVFSEDQMTLSQFIWTERLERCREALDNPVMTRRSITEIAFMWGFNNSAHFSKTFKERFGVPPGRVRQRTAPGRHLALN